MRKYYVTCGDLKNVVAANDPPEAIFLTLDRHLKDISNLSTVIKVSEIGHDEHPEDELFLLCDMFVLWVLHKKGIR